MNRRAAAIGFVVMLCAGLPVRAQIAELPDVPAKLPDMIDAKTIDTIRKGLDYLVRTQNNDGSWMSSGRYGSYPTAMTSLAGLAMLSSGSTPDEGPYSKNIRKALTWVIRSAKANNDGLIPSTGGEGRSMHGHGFAILFLAQCYGMQSTVEQAKEIREVLQKAVALTQQSQSDLGAGLDHAGGWYYTPESNNDEGSVTVTQLQALRACRNAGLKVDMRTIERSIAYLRYCQMPDGGICYSAQSRGSSQPAISAAAIACFYAAGVYDRPRGGTGKEAEMVDKLINYCRTYSSNVAQNGGHWFYQHYYLSQALYQRGGKDWKDYFPRIKAALLASGSNGQSPDGSWNGDGVGTVYGTAMALTILQLPFGRLPVYEK